MPLYEPSHLLEATSWVHDLHRCVTTRSAALELGITRRAAAALLADLPANEQGSGGAAKYEVHYSRVVRDEHAAEGSCNTSVKLVKEIVTAGQEEMPEGTIYSIALLQNGAPTVQSAHEKTKSMLRDMVLGDEQDEAGALDTDMLTDDVKPDERIQELLSRSDYDAMRLKRIAATLPKGVEPDLNGGGGGFGGASKPAFKKKPAPARKATSAASFFGASSSSAASKSGGGSSKPPTSTKPKPTNKLGFASASSSSAPKKKSADVGKENSENEDAMAVDEAPIAKKKAAPIAKKKASSPKDKKKKTSSSKANSPNRGNVDDFVGDEDEDEDFLESEAQRQARKAKDAKAAEDKLAEQKKKQAPANRRKVIQDDDDDDDAMDVDKKEKEAVYGEMDFHFNKGDDTANNAGGGKKEKKKRRKLVEKTSMDDRGFLITEKVWVEEDIPTDEEDNAEEAGPSPTKKLKSAFGGAAAAPGAAKKKKPAVKNTKGMKQAGLGSFFGAKKK